MKADWIEIRRSADSLLSFSPEITGNTPPFESWIKNFKKRKTRRFSFFKANKIINGQSGLIPSAFGDIKTSKLAHTLWQYSENVLQILRLHFFQGRKLIE